MPNNTPNNPDTTANTRIRLGNNRLAKCKILKTIKLLWLTYHLVEYTVEVDSDGLAGKQVAEWYPSWRVFYE
jgi:hypothetical protein